MRARGSVLVTIPQGTVEETFTTLLPVTAEFAVVSAASTADGLDRRVEQWWRRFAVALFLLIPLDLLTTLLAVEQHGVGVEANPVMRGLLDHGLVVVLAVNLAVVLLVVALFHAAVVALRRTPPAYHGAVTTFVNVWVGVLIAAGAIVVANNVVVLV